MSDTIRGRVLGLSNPLSQQLTVKVTDELTGNSLSDPSNVNADGRFELSLTTPASGRLSIRVTNKLGQTMSFALDGDSIDGEVLVVLPETSQDPRDYVANVANFLEVEREAVSAATTTIATEIEARNADEEAINDVLNGVLAQLVNHGGGDLQWKVGGEATIDSLTAKAVTEGQSAIDRNTPPVVAKTETMTDGEEMSTRELISRLSGGRTHRDGFWRADPLERIQQRSKYATEDGLPKPLNIESEDGDSNGSSRSRDVRPLTDGSPRPIVREAHEPGATRDRDSNRKKIKSTVKEKVNDLIEAVRLPEDPPLLVADNAVTGSGADVEFARGVSDITAFHDIHELVLAMPNVWQDVFDRRFVEVLQTTLRQLASAGVDIGELADADPVPDGKHPAERIFQRFQTLQTVFETSSARKIKPPISTMVTSAPTAIMEGITNPTNPVVIPYEHRQDSISDADKGAHGVYGPNIENVSSSANGSADQPAFEDEAPVSAAPPTQRLTLLGELAGYLKGKHGFTIFAADGAKRAINFALLLTWRQLWKPLNYQAGEIVQTMTLAPGAEQTVRTKRSRSLKKFTAEATKAQRSRSLETTDTARAESEILRKASASTDFQLTSEGSTKLLVANGSFTTSATRNVGREGNDTRRRFRESVMKAAQEYKDEHSMEVKTEFEDVFEEETTTKFRNPNDEVVLNVVFYALQRRYQIQEHLYRARPIILVAMPVPEPSEITSAWIIRYAWIIRRALLDDRFMIALDYLTTSFLGDQDVLVDLKRSVDEHTQALKEARHHLAEARALVDLRSQALRHARQSVSDGSAKNIFEAIEAEGIPLFSKATSLVDDALDFASNLLGGEDDKAEQRERAALIIEAAEDELLRAEREAREAATQVTAVQSALQQATREYVQAKRVARNHEVRIAELRVHISDNILYYMQSIWASMPPDQLYFELHNIQVPILDETVRVSEKGDFDQPGLSGFTQKQFDTQFVSSGGALTFRSLAEVARLEPIGFKGNMLMLEMYEGNALTDRILAPYLDQDEVLRDPNDIAASWTLTELREYADMIRAKVTSGEISQDDFDTIHVPFLRATLERLLTDPGPSEDIVIAPANSVFAELIVSGDSLLEPFKQEHRAIDVAIARSELRENELDNARRAVRIGTNDYEDPDIEAKYVFEGNGSATIVPPGGGGTPS